MEILECEKCGHILTPQTECLCNRNIDYLYGVVYQVSKVQENDYGEEE
jgi:hypothetical protein